MLSLESRCGIKVLVRYKLAYTEAPSSTSLLQLEDHSDKAPSAERTRATTVLSCVHRTTVQVILAGHVKNTILQDCHCEDEPTSHRSSCTR